MRVPTYIQVSILAISLTQVSAGPVRDSEPPLSTLSDVELFLHEDKDAAREELRRRDATQSLEKTEKFRKQLKEEIDRRVANRVEESPLQLLERFKVPPEQSRGMVPEVAIVEGYRQAAEADQEALRTAFVTDWETVAYPSFTETGPEAMQARERFMRYLKTAPLLCDSEREVIDMLNARLVNRGIEGEKLLLLQGLQEQVDTAGPLTAALVEPMLDDYRKWGVPEIGYADRADALPPNYMVLSRCGESGFDVIRRKGLERASLAIQLLGSFDQPEAEETLWHLFDATHADDRRSKAKLLAVIQSRQRKAPTDARRDRIRAELAPLLAMPDDKFWLVVIDMVVQVTEKTGDPWLLPHLDRLESALRDVQIEDSYEYGNNPDNAQKWLENCFKSIDSARTALSAK